MEGTSLRDGGGEGIGVKPGESHHGLKPRMILRSDENNPSNGCRHFSIRGYVGEICRLNRKICWPFVAYDNTDRLDEEIEKLPPLSIPQFRWWCCRKCSGLAHTSLDDPRENILESTDGSNTKACGMHIELKVEQISVSSQKKYSGTSNHESGCRILLPVNVATEITKSEGHEHPVLEKKLGNSVSSTNGALTIDDVHFSDFSVIVEEPNPTDTRYGGLAAAQDAKASQKREKTRKMVAKRLVNWKPDDYDQCKSVPDSKLENNQLSKLACQGSSSQDFDGNSELESEIQKSIGQMKCGLDQENNAGLSCNSSSSEMKKGVEINTNSKKQQNIMLYSGHEDDQDTGLDPVVGAMHGWNSSSNNYDSYEDDYCLEERQICNLHNSDQIRSYQSLENCGSRNSSDLFSMDGTACRRRVQKMRLLSDIIKECDMLAATNKTYVPKKTAVLESFKERISQAKTSSEGSPTRSYVDGDFTKSNEMTKKNTASLIKISDSTTIGSSQDSICSSSNIYEDTTRLQGCLEVFKNSNDCIIEIPEDEQKKDSETTLDEIPMDIVELMAKNQHERRLFDAGEHKSMDQLMNTCSKRTPSIMDITAVVENDAASLLDEDISFRWNLQCADAREKMFTYASSLTPIESDQMGLSPVMSWRDHLSACKRKLPYATAELSRRLHFPAGGHSKKNAIQESGWNKDATGCRWSPTTMWSAQTYDMFQKTPRQVSMSMHESPIGMQYNQTMNFESCSPSIDTDCLGSVAISKRSGNVIDHGSPDIKVVNSKAASYLQKRKEMVVPRIPSKIYPFSCRNSEIDYHPKDLLLSDLYKNETISAMNLLRLMNRDELSSVSGKSSRDESCACFVNQSQIFYDHQSEVSVVPVGYPSNITETSLQPVTPEGCDLNFPLRSIDRLPSPITDVSVVCTLRGDRSLDPDNGEAAFGSMGHHSSKISSMMHNTMPSCPSPRQCERELCSGSHGYMSLHYLDMSPCARESVNVSRHSQKREQSASFHPAEVRNEKDANAMPWSVGRDSMTEICTLNRNPAEISMQEEEEDDFMVQHEFHKRRKLSSSSNRHWKRQKTLKLAAIKTNM